jgi:uncharacterized damage-inducible protein DinB
MTLSKTIASRIQEVYLDGTWVAYTNYKDQLSKVNRDQALHQVGELNTIAKLTYHINYYLGGLIKVLDGGSLDISDKYSYDVSDIHTEDDWQDLVNELLTNAERFVEQVGKLTDEEALGPFVEEEYGTYLRNLEGVIEHSYYHLGQIVLLRKMM